MQPHRGDLFEMLYLASSRTEDSPALAHARSFSYADDFHAADDQRIRTSSAASGTLLMFRDSFGNALHADLAEDFGVALFDTLHLALFDDVHSYLLDDEERFEREIDKNLPNPVRVYDVPAPEIGIVKASVYCDDAVMDMAYALDRELGDEFVFAPSGKRWIDVMQRGVNKATGIEQVLDARRLTFAEVMAFGDSMNDYELLRRVGVSCAMGNGRSAVRQISTRVLGTNLEHSVQKEIAALLEEVGA